MKYQGIDLDDNDANSLIKLEKIIGYPIPHREPKYNSLYEFGFYCKDGFVKQLNLMGCGIREVPIIIGSFQNLSRLDLSDNFITIIKNLDLLENLEELILGKHNKGNYLSEIQGINNLNNLKVLQIDDNYIERMDGFEGLKKLENLILDDNFIQEILNIEHLENLNSLSLENNSIRNLKNIKTPIKLERISLAGNPIPLELEALNGYAPSYSINLIKDYYLKVRD